jgi:ribosomal protein S18 acetylase RimI-like enzyme
MVTVPDLMMRGSTKGHLRPFDHNRDMLAVADLVEVSFDDSIDADGQRYLRQMRDAAHNPNFLRWANAVIEHASLPLSGFVWEEDGHLVGNLSLIPFQLNNRRNYLIANVAVHPRYRRQGIARSLTSAALEHSRMRGAASAWLHVREDNEAAVKLYLSLGFREHTRRTTWHAQANMGGVSSNNRGLNIQSRRKDDWSSQGDWLARLYPPEVAWHLPLNLNAFRSDMVGFIYRVFSGAGLKHWSVHNNGRLEGVVSWRSSSSYYNHFWLAIPPDYDAGIVEALLIYARHKLLSTRPVALDFPARTAEQAILAAGFSIHQTLIWMTVPFS